MQLTDVPEERKENCTEGIFFKKKIEIKQQLEIKSRFLGQGALLVIGDLKERPREG